MGEFNQDDNISTYVNRVELFVEANSVAYEKKVAVLLTINGVKNYTCMYALLEGLLAPTNPSEKIPFMVYTGQLIQLEALALQCRAKWCSHSHLLLVDIPIHLHFVGDTRIVQCSPAHPREAYISPASD